MEGVGEGQIARDLHGICTGCAWDLHGLRMGSESAGGVPASEMAGALVKETPRLNFSRNRLNGCGLNIPFFITGRSLLPGQLSSFGVPSIAKIRLI